MGDDVGAGAEEWVRGANLDRGLKFGFWGVKVRTRSSLVSRLQLLD
jgi:hypothetical protein